MSKDVYSFRISADKKLLDISPTLYGIFFEDINRCADGGIYAEMVQNRSFENFSFKVYDASSGENGASQGKIHTPLRYWYGDTDKAEPLCEGGIEEYFGAAPMGLYYIRVSDGAELFNRGFGGEKEHCGMSFRKGESYDFSVFAKSESGAAISVTLLDSENNPVGETAEISVSGGDKWNRYTAALTAEKNCTGQLRLSFSGECCADMVSLFPEDVWGKDGGSPTAQENYLGNPNYRLRRDLMQTLYDMRPAFMRFPGGCISEGSFIWDNVYDWKDSVGDAALRRENFNVWGYNMTMGLGYMEYFQMAEDLGAEPLPVMACGILCQARSDYVHPAGGALREKYIKNFTDLIDFALSTDFDHNKWAMLRRDMGHEAPFGLHYLGIGNENWGEEFFADFEVFYNEIKRYADEKYPGYPLTIISTVGAQADDDAMKRGWNFLCGGHKGGGRMRFTDGEKNWEEEYTPYLHKKHYLDTIADEHYYRSNEYLLENTDRYNYYQRGAFTGCDAEVTGKGLLPQVFVGEYASTDKNTLRGAVTEAAVMTGFERNADIVRMAATAPLFNQPADDGTFRWTPDCIWFDKDRVYRTPTYFVQQMFMRNTGSSLLETRRFYSDGETSAEYAPRGGRAVSASSGRVRFTGIRVETADGRTRSIDLSDFSGSPAELLKEYRLECGDISALSIDGGLVIDGSEKTVYVYSPDIMERYTISADAVKLDSAAVIGVGAGLCDMGEKLSITEYRVGDPVHGTGLKIIKRGREGYTMGDFASSAYAGNLRAYYTNAVPPGERISVTLDFGRNDPGALAARYTISGTADGEISCRLAREIPGIYESATANDEFIFVKLVNARDSAENIRLEITGADINGTAECVSLSAGLSQCGIENINFGDEKITPSVTSLTLTDGCIERELPPQSVNVFRFGRNDPSSREAE